MDVLLFEDQHISRPDRLRGLIWGQFTADAAALGSHWLYTPEDQKSAYPAGIKGFETPGPDHYHAGKVPGDQTHYGDAALVLLESVAASGKFSLKDFGPRFMAAMAPGHYTGYVDHATRETLAAYAKFKETGGNDADFSWQEGGDDEQLATATSLAPALALHCGDPDLPQIVEKITRVRQNNDRAVAYNRAHAGLICELLAGRDVHSALHRTEDYARSLGEFGMEVRKKIQDAFGRLSTSVVEATKELGQGCPLSGSFPSAIHAAIKHLDSFENAILETLEAGGDNAGRAAMVGAWLGASHGIDGIPESWRKRLTNVARIDAAVETIVATDGNESE